MVRRIHLARHRLIKLIQAMEHDTVSTREKVLQLRTALAEHHGYDEFQLCENMGQILHTSLRVMTERTPKPGDWDNDPAHLL